MDVLSALDPANPYERSLARLRDAGIEIDQAMSLLVEDYLDGKPRLVGKRKLTRADRDAAFWSSAVILSLPVECWREESWLLALSRYFQQERVANLPLMKKIAEAAPESIVRAVRYSGLVLQQSSPRRTELDALATVSEEIAELCHVLNIFDQAYRERCSAVEMGKKLLAELSPIELLAYASLYAFRELVPIRLDGGRDERPESAPAEQEAWDAINDLLHWKVETCAESALSVSERQIALSIGKHLSPFLFPSEQGHPPRWDIWEGFERLLRDQIELNAFISRSADAFSYDEGICFVRRGGVLEIEVVDAGARTKWLQDGRKLDLLHGYWFLRGLNAFVASGLADQPMGRPENQETNQLAYIQAVRTHLRLMEVYGVDAAVTGESGERVDVFQALLSLELMSAFFQRDFLQAYLTYREEPGQWLAALSRLALEGFVEGENRLPLTWSDRTAKVDRITGWTVSTEHPDGSPRMASAILDFWTSDWGVTRKRAREGAIGLRPELFERPVLKLGQILIQLPWVVGVQNNSAAAINNLRRLGARRGEAGVETRRIEERLAGLFEGRGFAVALNWHPPAGEVSNAGEVDLVCHRDGVLIVIEVKSTYLRRSERDAWLHATTTLRKAGQQLRKKLAAVRDALAGESELRLTLGIECLQSELQVRGWIVDTSIECDHERFSGFLKVSVEEVLIALRDERDLLMDMERAGKRLMEGGVLDVGSTARHSLYSDGFDAAHFVDVIEQGAVWGELSLGSAVDDGPSFAAAKRRAQA